MVVFCPQITQMNTDNFVMITKFLTECRNTVEFLVSTKLLSLSGYFATIRNAPLF